MLRFLSIALPLTIILLAVFGVVAGALDLEPRSGSVIGLALWEQPKVPAAVVLSAWLMEACGLLALFLVTQGRCGSWWLDGLVAGWLGWVFRGPLLVLTVVVATRQPQEPWWRLAIAWWVLYSVIGLALGWLAKEPAADAAPQEDPREGDRETRVQSLEDRAPDEEPSPGESLDQAAAPPAGGAAQEPAQIIEDSEAVFEETSEADPSEADDRPDDLPTGEGRSEP